MLGFALQRDWHFMVTAVGWGLYVFGEFSFGGLGRLSWNGVRYYGHDRRIAGIHARLLPRRLGRR